MQLPYDNKIIENPLYFSYKEGTFDLIKALMEKNYATEFNVLKNWNLVRTFAINWLKLISDYIHLLEKEQFDEN